MQRGRDLGRFLALGGQPENRVLARRQRILAAVPHGQGQLRIDNPAPRCDPADRRRQLFGRGILEYVARDIGRERPAQRPGPGQVGHDQGPASGQFIVQLFRRGKAIEPWQVNINNRDVGLAGAGRRNYIIAILNGRYYFQVGFEFYKCHKCAAHHSHVLGEEDFQCEQFLLQALNPTLLTGVGLRRDGPDLRLRVLCRHVNRRRRGRDGHRG